MPDIHMPLMMPIDCDGLYRTRQLLLAIVAAVMPFVFSCGQPMSPEAARTKAEVDAIVNNEEKLHLDRIRAAKSDEERQKLIAEFESMPVKYIEFYDRWAAIHDVYGLEGWTDINGPEGRTDYDPSRSEVARDVQLLAATDYGFSDIQNGGLHQFFHNSTGTFAPEMVEWFERAGLADAAGVMKKAIAVFGPEFPRARAKRIEFLDAVPGAYDGPEKEWNPFFEMDRQLGDAVPYEVFQERANRWLRETCGIQSLSDLPPPFTRDE